MRSTGTPMMRATVGFCAVACIWWPIEVRFSSAVRPTTAAIASASTPRLCNETTRPRIETSPAGTMEGNGDASALKNCFTASLMPIASAMVAIASGSTPWRSIGSTSSSLKPSPSSSIDSRMPTNDREPERRAGMHHRQHQERRQHDEFALREIDGLRRLPQQREADRDEGVDRPGRKTCHEKIEQIGHASSPHPSHADGVNHFTMLISGRTFKRTPRRGSVQLRQHLLDDLLAVDDLDQETLAVDVALLIEGHIHQDAGLARRP